MRLSELQSKTIVSVVDGKNVGNIIDANIMMDGRIESLIIESGKSFFNFNRDSDTKILWKDITKIGEDVILVNINKKWVFGKKW